MTLYSNYTLFSQYSRIRTSIKEKHKFNDNEMIPIMLGGGTVGATIGAAAVGLTCGITGSLGNYIASLLDTTMVGAVGNFWTFCGVGTLATVITILPLLITDYCIQNSQFLNDHPILQDCLTFTTTILIKTGCLILAATALNLPIAATIIYMSIIPTLGTTIRFVQSVCSSLNKDENEVGGSSLALQTN